MGKGGGGLRKGHLVLNVRFGHWVYPTQKYNHGRIYCLGVFHDLVLMSPFLFSKVLDDDMNYNVNHKKIIKTTIMCLNIPNFVWSQ